MNKSMLVLGFVVMLLVIAGCDELPFLGKVTDVPGAPNSADEQDQEEGPVEPVEEETFFGANKTGGVQGVGGGTPTDKQWDEKTRDGKQVPQQTQVLEQDEPTRPYCGDGECNENEYCSTCEKDCGCGQDEMCYKGECREIECNTDEECEDDDPCTTTGCMFPGHPNSYCLVEPVTEFIHYDGCCPPGGYLDKDFDCEPVCGDGRCEYGENERSCLEDCEFYGEHGGSDSGGQSPQTPQYE